MKVFVDAWNTQKPARQILVDNNLEEVNKYSHQIISTIKNYYPPFNDHLLSKETSSYDPDLLRTLILVVL